MAHSEKWVRQLLRQLPRNPEELLERRSYWDPTFLRLFLDHVGDLLYREPRVGLRYAQVAPKLALLVPKGDGPDEVRQHHEQLVKAHAIRAGAYRIAGRLADAESGYALALRIADSAAISPAARADLNHRLAVLRTCQKRFAEALDLSASAVDTCFKQQQGGFAEVLALAEALATRGHVLNEMERYAEAIPIHGETLRLAGEALRRVGRRRSPAAAARVHTAARVNLAYALTHRGADAAKAIKHLRAAIRELRGVRQCRERHHCHWIEGKAWRRVLLDVRAEKAFKLARRGFLALELPWEIALVSLDLAAIYRTWNQWDDLETIAADTYERFSALCGDVEAIAALLLWVEAVENRKGAAAAIDAARQVLEARKTGS